MDIHSHSAQVRRLEVVDTGRRRRWTDDEKLRIIAESASGPRLVSSTARRHGISPSQLFGWRRDFGMVGAGNDAPAFLPVAVRSVDEIVSHPKSTASTVPGRVEIELSSGRIMRVDADIDSEALGRILDVVDRRR